MSVGWSVSSFQMTAIAPDFPGSMPTHALTFSFISLILYHISVTGVNRDFHFFLGRTESTTVYRHM